MRFTIGRIEGERFGWAVFENGEPLILVKDEDMANKMLALLRFGQELAQNWVDAILPPPPSAGEILERMGLK